MKVTVFSNIDLQEKERNLSRDCDVFPDLAMSLFYDPIIV